MSRHRVTLKRVRVRIQEKSDRLLVDVLQGVSWRPECEAGCDLGIWFDRGKAYAVKREHEQANADA